ncbi:Coenzyme F420 hydrogenase/dehydrogenase, beta subunit C-terminal domain [Clostridium psychrophilum]|uniref:Coenzyme F420 hydrogenase/dehydrogenase, beta subunit C-terminal domain n=1 Tax=Clostridium psychrophilum TaxID=132926 RepID=UPI001C0C22B0|nr:Coenzyme F420 hydrogenase/dehydrogenase, beta subunit C-terminal domain [Clostridium psychrophilum]MBU3180683.1 Coenzyme F420 hydrogenase/dehydrogenase, beta subunit C-terminal domain [Clostridium psychrophilum]
MAGLKNFLNSNYYNLITVDFVCHRVPSPKLFKKYIEWLGDNYGRKIISYDIRNKERGGGELMLKAKTETKTKFLPANLDSYYNAFLDGKTYRECCYQCKYASPNLKGDITIGDYLKIEKINPKFYSLEGVLLVLVNSDLGKNEFDKICNQYEVLETTLTEAKMNNRNLYSSVVSLEIRSYIYKVLTTEIFETYIDKYLPMQSSLKSKLKFIIPYRIKAYIKKVKQ